MSRKVTNPRPRKLGAKLTHYWLAKRMAKRGGVDLCQATETGTLSQRDWSALVTKCQSCDWTEGCQRFLDAPDSETRAIPQTCANVDTFKHLQNNSQIDIVGPLKRG